VKSGQALARSWMRVGHRPRAALIILTQGQCLSLASAWEVGGSTPLGRRGSLPSLDDLNGARPTLKPSPSHPHAAPPARLAMALTARCARCRTCSARLEWRNNPGRSRPACTVSGAVAPAREANFKYKNVQTTFTPYSCLYKLYIICYHNGGVCSCRPCQRAAKAASSAFVLGSTLSVRIRSRLRRRVRVFVPLSFFVLKTIIRHCLIHGHERRCLVAPCAYYTKFNDLYGDVYNSTT
jgi:hypothetical protein